MSFTPIRLAKIRKLNNAKWWPPLGEIGIPGSFLLEVCGGGSHSEEQDFVKFNILVLWDPAMPLQVYTPERSAYMSSGPCMKMLVAILFVAAGVHKRRKHSAIFCPSQKGGVNVHRATWTELLNTMCIKKARQSEGDGTLCAINYVPAYETC